MFAQSLRPFPPPKRGQGSAAPKIVQIVVCSPFFEKENEKMSWDQLAPKRKDPCFPVSHRFRERGIIALFMEKKKKEKKEEKIWASRERNILVLQQLEKNYCGAAAVGSCLRPQEPAGPAGWSTQWACARTSLNRESGPTSDAGINGFPSTSTFPA